MCDIRNILQLRVVIKAVATIYNNEGGDRLITAPITAITTMSMVMLIILAVLVAALIIITIWGNKQQKKSEEAQRKLVEAAQPVTMLVIDKKRMKISEANLPK